MMFATVKVRDEKEFIGLVVKEKVLHLKKAEFSLKGESMIPDSMLEAITIGDLFYDRVEDITTNISSIDPQCFYLLSDIQLLAPIPYPRKNILCIGKNYAEHAMELRDGEGVPDNLIVFTKAPTTVVGDHAVVSHHKDVTNELDYEGELAIVIGKQGKAITESEAMSYVFGYTIINDITARDLQEKHKQYFLGKSLDCTCPMGPWIIHTSAFTQPNIVNITTKVNGEVRQNSNTSKLIFPIEKIISTLSRGMTLEPGDIIATGTPAGVGKGYNPPRYLQPGDKVEITVEGIGTLTNHIESE